MTDSGKMRGFVNVIFFPAFTCHGCKNSLFRFLKGKKNSIYFRGSEKCREEEKRKEKKYYVKRSTCPEGL